jgi:hypothetical protein
MLITSVTGMGYHERSFELDVGAPWFEIAPVEWRILKSDIVGSLRVIIYVYQPVKRST